MISAQTLSRLSRGKVGFHFSGSCFSAPNPKLVRSIQHSLALPEMPQTSACVLKAAGDDDCSAAERVAEAIVTLSRPRQSDPVEEIKPQ
jgi:hypothetical protein